MPSFSELESLRKVDEGNTRFVANLDEGFELLEIVYDKQGRVEDFVFLEVNHAYERQSGLEAVDVIGQRKREVVPVVDQQWYDSAAQAIETGQKLSYQYFNPKVNRFFDTQFLPLSRSLLAVIFKDVTKRKQAEDALELTEKNLEDIVNLSPFAFALFDSNGVVVQVNDTWEKQWQIPKELVLGKFNVLKSKQIVDTGLLPVVQRVFAGDTIKSYELAFDPSIEPVSWGKGRRRWLSVTAYSIKTASGLAVAVLSEDITERKNLEKQLQENMRLAAIGQTAGMVGHDIRNPLQAVLSDTFLLKEELASMPDGQTKSEVAESLDGIEKNVEYINKIVQDLQDYSRPLTPEVTEAALSKIFINIFETVTVPDNVKLSIDVKDGENFRTDPMLLQRALTNLVNNAIQAMPNGGRLDIHGQTREDPAVITVADTGSGIPEEVKPKLFTPMTTTKSKGQGFGLAVAKRLVEALKGEIVYESELGKGTKFIIKLPL
jgi:PAS domain S-box-containing protein